MSNTGIVLMAIKCVMIIYAGWKFLTEDKEKISTLWYGMLLIALMM